MQPAYHLRLIAVIVCLSLASFLSHLSAESQPVHLLVRAGDTGSGAMLCFMITGAYGSRASCFCSLSAVVCLSDAVTSLARPAGTF